MDVRDERIRIADVKLAGGDFFLGDFLRERAGRRETEGDWSRTKHRLFEGEIKRSKEDPHEGGLTRAGEGGKKNADKTYVAAVT